jgi:hypothetical protein
MLAVGILYVHLVYLMSIWFILLPFGILLVIWYIFAYLFGMLYEEKSGNPDVGTQGVTCSIKQYVFGEFRPPSK